VVLTVSCCEQCKECQNQIYLSTNHILPCKQSSFSGVEPLGLFYMGNSCWLLICQWRRVCGKQWEFSHTWLRKVSHQQNYHRLSSLVTQRRGDCRTTQLCVSFQTGNSLHGDLKRNSTIKPTNALYILVMFINPTRVSAATEPSSGVQGYVHFNIHCSIWYHHNVCQFSVNSC
jgi:hypothetical protein